MIFPMLGGWFVRLMADLFVGLLDTMAYNLLATAYNVFDAVSEIDIFGASEAGAKLYNGITSRLYTMLSIVMVFVFSYQLIMMIVDPDGKEKNASTKLVKDTLFSIIIIILLPTIFKYMSIFQTHVIKEGTIARIVMGSGGSYNDSPGKSIALMTYMSFYHPEGTSWTTFFGPVETKDANGKTVYIDGLLMDEGKIEDELLDSPAYQNCLEHTKLAKTNETGTEHTKTCEKFVRALAKWDGLDSTFSGIGYITGDGDLRDYVDEDKDHTMEYLWILSTGAGLLVAWTFFAYAIDIGTRAIKLGILEIIAPIPMVLRIFPQSRKTFDTWFMEIKAAYLEIFLRLAIIFFGVEVIKMVPDFIDTIFSNSSHDGLTKCIATVILIIGILKFCQIAPELFKEIFSAGNNLFKGLNLSPKIRSHIEDNKAAMKGYNAITSAGGGLAVNLAKGAKRSWETTEGMGDSKGARFGRTALAGLSAIAAAPRGVISGAAQGLQSDNNKISKASAAENATEGLIAGAKSFDRMTKNKTRANINNALKAAFDPGNMNAKDLWAITRETMGNQLNIAGGSIKDGVDKWKDKGKNLLELLNNPLGVSLSSDTYTSLKKILEEATKGSPKIAGLEETKKELESKMRMFTPAEKQGLASADPEKTAEYQRLSSILEQTKKEIDQARAEYLNHDRGAGKDVGRAAMAQLEAALKGGTISREVINQLETSLSKTLTEAFSDPSNPIKVDLADKAKKLGTGGGAISEIDAKMMAELAKLLGQNAAILQRTGNIKSEGQKINGGKGSGKKDDSSGKNGK